MISVFNREKLGELLQDFYRITKMRITVFDENRRELIAYPEEIPAFCKIVRSCETGRLSCANCDREACEKAARQRTTQIYRCHAGLTEAVTPLVVGNTLVGFLFFGHVFSYPDHESGWQEIRQRCARLPIEEPILKSTVMVQPILDQEYVRSATQILLAVASYLVMERMATIQTDRLAGKLDSYLSAHFTENFTAPELCGIFGIGKTQLYQLSHKLYGCGICEHIRDLRIALAKSLLLEHNEMTLGTISTRCGYTDYNYFIAVFSRIVGCPPGQWRKENT